MFKSLFGGIQSILQIVPKTVGYAANTILNVVDYVLPSANPFIQVLKPIPILGPVLETTLNVAENMVTRTSTDLKRVAEELQNGKVFSAVDILADGVTHLVGNTVTSVAKVAHTVIDVTNPITDITDHIPVIGDILSAVTDTAHNFADSIQGAGNYIELINPSREIAKLISDPIVKVGEIIEDTSKLIGNVVNDIDPILNLTNPIPVVAQVVDAVEYTADTIIKGVHDTGTILTTVTTNINFPDLPYI